MLGYNWLSHDDDDDDDNDHHDHHDHHHYAQHNWWLGGGTTALIALIPLFIIAFLLYSGWSRLKQVEMVCSDQSNSKVIQLLES